MATFLRAFFRTARALIFLGAGALQAQPTTNFTASSADQLQAVLAQAFTNNVANPALANTITVTGNISATVQMVVNANVAIHGGGYTINMNNSDRAFFIAGGNVAISNLTIQNGSALGGSGWIGGGGGGAGLGGAIFVGSGTYYGGVDPETGVALEVAAGLSAPNVTFSGVSFVDNTAEGGNSTITPPQWTGGGGGMGGSAGFGGSSGGGGFGTLAMGGSPTQPGGFAGEFVNVATLPGMSNSGGNGGGGGGGAGGTNGGGGGGAAQGDNGSGGGGGVGGGRGYFLNDDPPNSGGNGGFGGGGGGNPSYFGGDGGFGGGGGGTPGYNGGNGGFGGGGGGYGDSDGGPGTGGFGAGRGSYMSGSSPGSGGGGLGAGGAVFVMAGASVTVQDGGFAGNSVTAGTGYVGGSAYGADLFLGADVVFNVSSNLTVNSLGGAGNLSDSNVAANAGDPNAQGGIIKTGAGNLMLAGTNYYTGATTVNSGTLTLLAGALEQGTSNVVIGQNPGDNATLVLGSNSTLTLGGFNGTSGTDSPVVIAQNAGSAGTVVIGAGAGSSGADIGARIFQGGNGTASLVFTQEYAAGSGDNPIYPFLTTLTGNLGISQNGNGTTRLNPLYGPNTFTGAVAVDSGTLATASDGNLGSLPAVSVAAGATLQLGGNETVASLNGMGSVVLDQAGLAVSGNIPQMVFGGSISGNGSLAKNGTGSLTLSGINTFSGNTTASAGTLLVDGSLGASSAVGVAAGATLGGNGTIGGNLTLQGTLSPGASTGSLSAGRIVFDAASVFDYEADSYAPASSAGDLLVVAGNVDIAAGAAIQFSDLSQQPAAFAPGTILSLVNYGGEWNGGFFSLNGTSLGQGNHFIAGGTVWSIDYAATSGGLNFQTGQIAGKFINITAVPEPSVVALLALGALAWAGLAGRRRNRERLTE